MSMLRVDFRIARNSFAEKLNDLQRERLPAAAQQALKATALEVKAKMTEALPEIFAKVTPFTARAMGATWPGSKHAAMTAEVFVLDIQAHYLGREETGGERTPADNTRKGAHALILPNEIRRDAFGNIPFGEIRRLSALAARDARMRRHVGLTQAFGGKLNKRQRDFAQSRATSGIVYLAAGRVPSRFGGEGGFFERDGSPGHHTIKRLTTFKGGAHYAPKFGFRKKFEAFATAAFLRNLETEMARALAA